MRKTFPKTEPGKKYARDKTAMSLFIIFLKIDYVKDLLKKSNCDIL